VGGGSTVFECSLIGFPLPFSHLRVTFNEMKNTETAKLKRRKKPKVPFSFSLLYRIAAVLVSQSKEKKHKHHV
jgi:hypothetical protein